MPPKFGSHWVIDRKVVKRQVMIF